jgi:glycosyltransferase involved in cell wall biosynthesis
MFIKDKLHMLLMPSWYKSVENPVLGTFFEEQARAMQKYGYQVGVIYPEYTAPKEIITKAPGKFNDFYMDKGIPTFHIRKHGSVPKMRRLSYAMFSSTADRVFEKYCAVFGKPDIIHAHSVFHAGIAALHISRKHDIPLVITEHLTAYLMGYITNSTDIQVAQEVFRNADGALIVSHNFRKDLEQQLELEEHTFTEIHNVVSDLFFEGYTPAIYRPGEPFCFFTNSFLLPRKNVNMIIDAMKIMIDKGRDVQLRIGGEGPMHEALQDQVNRLGLQKHITLTGKLWRREVKEEIDRSHAFVLASQYETFGVVLIESLACGRPVVCTDSGGPRDFITEEQGVMVSDHDAGALADGMMQLMDRYQGYNQKELIRYCHENFNEHHISSLIREFYMKVLEKRKQQGKRK